MQLYWGDLHNHCGITYGYGGLDNALRAAASQLDFCTITPHAMWPDMPQRREETAFLVDFHQKGFDKIAAGWPEVKQVVEAANRDGDFVTFHSFEMHHSGLGDVHIVSPDAGLALLYEKDPAAAVKAQSVPCIAIPHHIAYTPGYRGIDWNAFDEGISPVVEVYSKHGCGVSDTAPYPYYHDMGPRDSRNTAWAGLRAGKRFSFAGSTDHHAGYPGSYGDGRVAVLAAAKTRADIWQALVRGHTYAVTGDKIACGFTVNGADFGSRITAGGPRRVAWQVTGADRLSKAVIYKNLRPLRVIPGEALAVPEAGGAIRCKVRVELGWGNTPEPYLWQCEARIEGGCIHSAEPCFRGRSVLTPKPGQRYGDDVNALRAGVLASTGTQLLFEVETFPNFSTLHPQTSAMVLELEGAADSRLCLSINGRRVEQTLGALLQGGVTGQMESWNSHAYKVHAAVPQALYSFEGALVDAAPAGENDFYHMEIMQANGQAAWVSPVFVGC